MPRMLATRPAFLSVPVLVAAALTALLGWSATAWVLRWPTPPATLPFAVVSPAGGDSTQTSSDLAGVARALGAAANTPAQTPAPAEAVLVLSGVAVPAVALIGVNGQPVKPVRVGQTVMPGWQLQSVSRLEAVLVSGQGATMTLRLPARP